MSDELFPDAVAIAPVAIATPRKRRGFGIASFVLGLLSVVGDLAVVVAGFVALGTFSNDLDSGLGLAFVVLLASIVAFWGGLVLAVLAIVFGIIALVRNRGRVLAVIGIVLALITAVTNVAVGVQLLVNADALSQFGAMFS
ncbi:hypothetical protein BH11ACT3_BH11ACT3_14280 [soil metagenome]